METSEVKFTVNEFIDYSILHGNKAAYDLLILAGPNAFEDYDDYVQLESFLNS